MLNFRQEDTRGTQVGLTGLTWTTLTQAVKSILYSTLENGSVTSLTLKGNQKLPCRGRASAIVPPWGEAASFHRCSSLITLTHLGSSPTAGLLPAASKAQKSLLQPLLLEAVREVLGVSCCTGCRAVWTRMPAHQSYGRYNSDALVLGFTSVS